MKYNTVFFESKITDETKFMVKAYIHMLLPPNGTIIINYPGIGGTIDGYNNKYGNIAEYVKDKGIGTFVRIGNPLSWNPPQPLTMIENLKTTIDYCISNSVELSGTDNLQIYLSGFSAGASAISAVAHNYKQVKKILLIAPSGDSGKEAITDGLEKFTEEVYIVIGEKDEIVGKEAGQIFYDLANRAKKRELETIPDCNHQFTGGRNGKIMSHSYIWAFDDDVTTISPDKGVKLYD